MNRRYTHSRKPVRVEQGLWPMRVAPSPDFRWGIGTRRSKLNEDGTEGSTGRQENTVHKCLKDREMGVVVRVYSDVASAYDEGAKRPGFDQMLFDLRTGVIDGIAVWKLDRLVRRVSQYRKVLTVLEESGGRLFSMLENIDTADTERKLVNGIILDLLARLAQMESENTSARIELMQEDRAQRGLPHLGRYRGYGHNREMTALVDNEAAILNEAGDRFVKGESWRKIARDLNKRQVSTVMGTPWLATTLAQLFRQPRLIGKREFQGSLVDLAVTPPILDKKMWERIRDKMAEHSTGSGKVQRFLSSYIECGNCGHTLIGNTGSPANGSKQIYACRKKGQTNGASCGGMAVVSAPVDDYVAEEICKFLAERHRVEAVLTQLASGPEMDGLRARLQELNESAFALDQALKPPPGKPRMAIDRYWSLMEEVETEREEIHRRLAVTREAALLKEVLSWDDVEGEWEDKPVEWRRAIVKLVTERIVVEPRGRGASHMVAGRNAFDYERVKIKFSA